MSASSTMLPPLPERMRPKSLDQYVGQRHLVGDGCVLRKMIESGNLSSFILWGPPGVGKTTLAHIIAETMDRDFYTLSAVASGVKDVRDVFDKAKKGGLFNQKGAPILFAVFSTRKALPSCSSTKSTASTRRSRTPCSAP